MISAIEIVDSINVLFVECHLVVSCEVPEVGEVASLFHRVYALAKSMARSLLSSERGVRTWQEV